MTDPVQAQYEAFPYPHRDPRDEAKRLVTGSPSYLAELNHYAFGGRLDLRRPFRALVAGGGTGDATIMLAQHLADAGATAAEVVYLDWSAAARRIAEARAIARGLANIHFVTGSLLDLPTLGLGHFDYIDCCGVLHHLDDPPAGLNLLADALGPRGGMGLMLYGRIGRTGVYEAQALLRSLDGGDESPPARLALAKRVLKELPPTNWLRRNPALGDLGRDDGIVDLLLHARDRAYDVGGIVELVAGAGLRLVAFVPPARYEPRHFLTDATLLKRLDTLDPLARAAFAERLTGNIRAHVLYVVRRDNPVEPARADSPAWVPVLRDLAPEAAARGLVPGGQVNADADGLKVSLPLPPLGPAIAGLVDGRRTLGEIHVALSAKRRDLDWEEFKRQFDRLSAALGALDKLLLSHPPPA